MWRCTSTKPCGDTTAPHPAKIRLEWGEYGGGDFCEHAAARLHLSCTRAGIAVTKSRIEPGTEAKHWSSWCEEKA